ncbi:hypothetical protein DFH06DRAFT_1195235 [Mycena polygramma]|nr:hypothetical protein DFH06DRAFT_1195235 [Mycena polygramma]
MPSASDIFTPKAARTRIAAIDAEIDALQKSILDLQLERSTLKSHLDALVYPVLTLPNEVVSEVFLHTIPRWPSPPIDTPLQSPLLLGQICSKWREISISTPSLWTKIDIWLDRVAAHDHDNKLRLLALWLTRSRNCPLLISIIAGRAPMANENFAFRRYIEAIVPHSTRWDTLHLAVPFRDLPLICGALPLLRELAMTILDADETPLAPVHVFDKAPKLEWLHLLPTLILPLIVNVTDLTIKLRSFEEGLTGDTPDIPPFPHLRTLNLLGTDDLSSRTKLTLPSLHQLSVDAISLAPRAIKALLSRSRCHGPSFYLVIRESAFTEAYYRRVLRTVGTIVVEEPADGGIGFLAASTTADSESADEATEESGGDAGDEDDQSSDEYD